MKSSFGSFCSKIKGFHIFHDQTQQVSSSIKMQLFKPFGFKCQKMPGVRKRAKHPGLFSKENQPKQQKRTETQALLENSLVSQENIVEGKRRATTTSDEETQDSFPFFMQYKKMVKLLKRYACMGCNQFGNCVIRPTQFRGVGFRFHIFCDPKTGGCGYSEADSSIEEDFNLKLVISAKAAGIRARQINKLFTYLNMAFSRSGSYQSVEFENGLLHQIWKKVERNLVDLDQEITAQIFNQVADSEGVIKIQIDGSYCQTGRSSQGCLVTIIAHE